MKPTHTDPDEQIEVRASWGHMLAASTKEIIDYGHGISAGARGVALIAQGMGKTPTVDEVCELTGDEGWQVAMWIEELHGTGYLYWED